MGNTLGMALSVALLHTAAMTLSGAALAVGVYVKFGLNAVRQTWFNLDTAWALSLILVGLFGMGPPLMGQLSG